MINIRIKNLLASAVKPKKAHPSDAAFDLVLPCAVKLPSGRSTVPLGFALEIPDGYYAVIAPRSGNSVKGIPCDCRRGNGASYSTRADADVMLGIIDAGYRGEVQVMVQNHGAPVSLPAGTRIAQMLVCQVEPVAFRYAAGLSDSERGDAGFGSTD